MSDKPARPGAGVGQGRTGKEEAGKAPKSKNRAGHAGQRGGTSRRPPQRGPQGRRPAGLASRVVAAGLVDAVLIRRQSLDEALANAYAKQDGDEGSDAVLAALAPRDRGFARLLAMTVLRRTGQLSAIVGSHLEKPLAQSAQGARDANVILLLGAAQLLFLETPPHAAIDTAVALAQRKRRTQRFAGLINAVLRRVAEAGTQALDGQDEVTLNIPDWMLAGWGAAYGARQARAIATASLHEAALDITPLKNPTQWAERLKGELLATGSIRRPNDGPVEALVGFAEGAWLVQDAAAALPAKLLGDVAGKSVADLCAAPGGKTAQLAAAGSAVTAVDVCAERLSRVRANLDRLRLEAELVAADAATWAPGRQFDAVLVDAPCTATGTIRRHPDILRLKRAGDRANLTTLQARILDNAAGLVRPGGLMVYCTCSLEPEEGEEQITRFLESRDDYQRVSVVPGDVGGVAELIRPPGDLRTLPSHLSHNDPGLSGIDGFYACKLRRRA